MEDGFGGDYGGAKEDDLRVLLAEVIGAEKKATPRVPSRREWSERERARTSWPCRTKAFARNCPKFPNPMMAILSFGEARWNSTSSLVS